MNELSIDTASVLVAFKCIFPIVCGIQTGHRENKCTGGSRCIEVACTQVKSTQTVG